MHNGTDHDILPSLVVLSSSRSGPCLLPDVKKNDTTGWMPRKVVVEWHQIACGGKHTVGVTPTGEVYTWGLSGHGELGHGRTVASNEPKLVTCLIGKEVVHVACGEEHTAVVTSKGELYTWYVYKVPYSLCIPYYLQY